MRKFIFTVLMAFSAIAVNAQTAVQTSKILDNTFVGVEAGVSTPLTLSDVFPLNTTATLRVGKLFTPVVGAELEATAWLGSRSGYAERFDGYSHNFIRGSYVGVNGLVNLTNLFYGYNGQPRNFEVSAVAGPGWVHTFTPNNNDKYNNHLGVKTGLDLAFNLGKAKAHTISIRPAILWNLSVPGNSRGQLAFNSKGAQLYLGVGYTYHFKTSNGTHSFKLYDVGALNDEINSLRAQLAEKPNEVEKIVKEVVKEEVPVEVFKFVPNEWVVSFEKAKATLTDEAKAKLDAIPTDFTVKIVGKASPEGSSAFNKKLSQDRADAVSNYLTNKGVKVDSSVGVGVENNASQRVAIITIVE